MAPKAKAKVAPKAKVNVKARARAMAKAQVLPLRRRPAAAVPPGPAKSVEELWAGGDEVEAHRLSPLALGEGTKKGC